VPGEDKTGISISKADFEGGSPRLGDMIARNPQNHADQWLVAAQYFADNFEPSVEPKIYCDDVTDLATFRRWLMHRQLPPGAGTDYIGWLDPKQVLEQFDAAMRGQH